MVGFYRKFITDCSSLTAPLSDMTAKHCCNEVTLGDKQEQALNSWCHRVPYNILKLPDLNQQFILQTDTKGFALELLSCECNYSVGERECLAVVWAVKKFSRFLLYFLDDHRPLKCLNTVNFWSLNKSSGCNYDSTYCFLCVCAEYGRCMSFLSSKGWGATEEVRAYCPNWLHVYPPRSATTWC